MTSPLSHQQPYYSVQVLVAIVHYLLHELPHCSAATQQIRGTSSPKGPLYLYRSSFRLYTLKQLPILVSINLNQRRKSSG